MAYLDGKAVNIKDVNHDDKYTCIECEKPMIPKLGKIKIHHFAHKFTGNCNPDNALHETSKYYMQDLFNKAKQDGKDLIVSIPCIKCGRDLDYILPTDGNIKVEFSVIEKTRSDLVVLNKDGSAHSIIEIVVTHDLEPQTRNAYLKSKIPVVKIKPTWEKLDKVSQTMNINKMCDSCKKRKADIDAKINEKTIGWWVNSEKSGCWGIHTKNYHLGETSIVRVITKSGNAQIKKLGCKIKSDQYGWIYHVDDNLTENEKDAFKDTGSKINCTWKSVWCIKVYDPTNSVNKGDIIKVKSSEGIEFKKLGCILSRDKNTKFFHPACLDRLSYNENEMNEIEYIDMLNEELYKRT